MRLPLFIYLFIAIEELFYLFMIANSIIVIFIIALLLIETMRMPASTKQNSN